MQFTGLVNRFRTVLVLAIMILATACSPSGANPVASSTAPAGPLVRVEPAAASALVSEQLKVFVKAEKITNLTAVEIHLSFDPTLLEVVELVDGSFIKIDFSVIKAFDNTAGTIDYAVAQINGSPANGDGSLLEIVFRAKAAGEAVIRFHPTKAAPAGVLLADSSGGSIQVSALEGVVQVR